MTKHNNRDLSRRAPRREPYKTVLIVCEGTKTEKNYFNNLVAYERLSSVNIRVLPGQGTDPRSVVKTAIDYMQKQEKYLAFDEVFCVIDRDNHQTFDDATLLARQKGIQLIVSYPSFEYWYLCHFRYSRAPIIRKGNKSAGDHCESLLSACWQEKFKENYSKAMKGVYEKLLSYLDDGMKNAALSLKSAINEGQFNPSTQAHELVKFLRSIRK